MAEKDELNVQCKFILFSVSVKILAECILYLVLKCLAVDWNLFELKFLQNVFDIYRTR